MFGRVQIENYIIDTPHGSFLTFHPPHYKGLQPAENYAGLTIN
jgi:hypothetical protein